jgi:hypothetical protein
VSGKLFRDRCGDRTDDRVGQRLRPVDVAGLPGEGGMTGRGLEGRVLLAQLLVFAPDAEEPAVMRRPPVPAPLSPLDDLVESRAATLGRSPR